MMKNLISILLSVIISLFYHSGFAQSDTANQASGITKKVYNEKIPEYPGGEEARVKFLSDNIKYPKEARKNKIQGKVVLQIIVRADGFIDPDIKVLRDVGGGCTEEAIRGVKLMPQWKPGTQDDIAVPVYFNLPITFSLK